MSLLLLYLGARAGPFVPPEPHVLSAFARYSPILDAFGRYESELDALGQYDEALDAFANEEEV